LNKRAVLFLKKGKVTQLIIRCYPVKIIGTLRCGLIMLIAPVLFRLEWVGNYTVEFKPESKKGAEIINLLD
jgi:hypothetical protein